MFQQTIQDLLAVAEAGTRTEDVLAAVFGRIAGFEKLECGEFIAHTDRGVARFVFGPGLNDSAPLALKALGSEPTLRFDTAAQMKGALIPVPARVQSLLALRLDAPGASSGAIVLGHSRAWSFAAAPLSRIRAIGNVALRLLLASETPAVTRGAGNPADELILEVARLRAHIASLEGEIVALRADQTRKRSDKPR